MEIDIFLYILSTQVYIPSCRKHATSRDPGDDALEDAAELRLHFVTHQHQEHLQSPEGHRFSPESRIATGEIHHHDLVSDGLMANYQTAKPACGSLIGRGIDSGMLDEINHREHEISSGTIRAAHVEVGHALLQLVGHLLRHDGHDGHVCRV